MEKWIPLFQAASLLGYAYTVLRQWIKRSENNPRFYPPELRARYDYHYRYDFDSPRHERVILLNISLDIIPAITPRFLEILRRYGIKRRGKCSGMKPIDLLKYVPPPQKEKMIYCPHTTVIIPYSQCLYCWVFKNFSFKPAEEEKPDGFTINHCIKGYTANTYPREEIICRL